jgi:hypothetical protein
MSDNPIITSTVFQLAFAAWQKAQGLDSLDPSGDSYERFDAWWCAQGGFLSIKDACQRAWNAGMGFDDWWKSIVDSQPAVSWRSREEEA